MKNNELLKIENLCVSFFMPNNKMQVREYCAVSKMSICLKEGEILAIIGASGSGKSILAHAVLNILPSNAKREGKVFYKNEQLDSNLLKKYLGKEIAFIPQSLNYLDPRMKMGKQIKGIYGTDEAEKEILKKYELNEKINEMYPFELSGGMARRALFASALIHNPNLIIADEPTPGMTVEQAKISLTDLKNAAERGAGILLITHDINLVLFVADRVAIVNNGEIIEIADTKAFEGRGERLEQPFTKALWLALPQNDFKVSEGYVGI